MEIDSESQEKDLLLMCFEENNSQYSDISSPKNINENENNVSELNINNPDSHESDSESSKKNKSNIVKKVNENDKIIVVSNILINSENTNSKNYDCSTENNKNVKFVEKYKKIQNDEYQEDLNHSNIDCCDVEPITGINDYVNVSQLDVHMESQDSLYIQKINKEDGYKEKLNGAVEKILEIENDEHQENVNESIIEHCNVESTIKKNDYINESEQDVVMESQDSCNSEQTENKVECTEYLRPAEQLLEFDNHIKNLNPAVQESKFNNDFDDKIFDQNIFMELARISWKSDLNTQHYTRGSIWSPDGSCILTAVNCDGMQIFELPNDLYAMDKIESERTVSELKPAVNIKEGGTVYDYVWYPFMNSSLPESCCWIASRQHEPIMMWDAFTGELRCTYRGYDPYDEVESAISVQFSPDGKLVYGGYKKSIKIFQTDRPGKEYTEITTKFATSCIAVSDSHPNSILCGSWKSNIYLYDIRSPDLGYLASLKSHKSGVTYVKFCKDGQKLYSGARKDEKIYEWDMRNYTVPLNYFDRNATTNQRIYFDLSPSGNLLGSGDTNGLINIWDLKNKPKHNVFSLHQDCVNGFNFHPSLPIICSSSGQFHFENDKVEAINKIKNLEYENSLILWWYSDV